MLYYIRKHSSKILYSTIFLYVILFSFLSLKKYYNFDYTVFDLAIFNQVFFNSANGNWFDMTLNLNNYLADHFTPIIFLLLPFYKILPKAETLLILQSIFLALSAWPLFKITKLITKDSLWALLLSFSWLLNPFVHSANLFEFHLLPVAAFFIFWTFYFYKKNNFKVFLIFFVLSLLVREDISLILLGFWPLALLDKKSSKWKIIIPVLSIFYFLLSITLVKYFFITGNYKFFVYYKWVFDALPNIFYIILKVFSLSSIFNFLFIFLIFLFLPFLKPKYLFLALLPFAQLSLLETGFGSAVYNTHYILSLLPAIFIALIFSLNHIKNRKPFLFSKHIYENLSFYKIILFFSIIYFLVFLSPIKYVLFHTYKPQENKYEFVREIKKDDSLMTDMSLISFFSGRKEIYPLHYSYFGKGQFGHGYFKLPEVDHILIDYSDFFSVLTTNMVNPVFKDKNNAKNFRATLDNYCIEKIKNNMVLWSQYCETDKILYKKHPHSQEQQKKHHVFKDGVLEFYLNKSDLEDKNYLVRFYKQNYYFDVPLDYAMWPVRDWSDDSAMSFYYYLSDDVYAFKIFSWQGQNKIGKRKEYFTELKLENYHDKVYFR